MQRHPPAIASLIGRLAAGCVEAQRMLDRQQSWPAPPEEPGDGNGSTPGEPVFCFRSHAIDARVVVRRRRSLAASGQFSLLGEPLHSFLYHRIATEATEFNRISIEVEAAPLRDAFNAEGQEISDEQ